MDEVSNISESLTGFIEGKNKPTIQFEFTYTNLVFIGFMFLLVSVVSAVIVNKIVG